MLGVCVCVSSVVVVLMLFSRRAWREKLEHAEVRKQEETKELQVNYYSLTFDKGFDKL